MRKRARTFLLDQLLCLEETPQVEHLPCCQPNETEHGEDAKVQHTCVGGLCSSGGGGERAWSVVKINNFTYLNN